MKTIAIIGAGPGGLMAAEQLASRGHNVTVYDHRPSPARKFLMAGRGGLNITHSEPLEKFISHYGPAADFLRPAIESFTPQDLRDWCAGLGEDTFIGSSGRVFPKSFKASPLLRAWLKRLENLGVTFRFNSEWTGQNMGGSGGDGVDATILALGGASWPRLGSDGHWATILEQHGIKVNPFRPSNCGFLVEWTPVFQEKFAGTPLKNIALTHENKTIRGEIIITRNGVEGGGIYALSALLRGSLLKGPSATTRPIIYIDMKPDLSHAEIEKKLATARNGRDSFSNFLRKSISLPPPAIGILQEDKNIKNLSAGELAARIKSCPIPVSGTSPIERAISTAGGIDLSEVGENFELKKWPNTYAIGEMLDWEAPTGGYLLQATFSMAVWLSRHFR